MDRERGRIRQCAHLSGPTTTEGTPGWSGDLRVLAWRPYVGEVDADGSSCGDQATGFIRAAVPLMFASPQFFITSITPRSEVPRSVSS